MKRVKDNTPHKCGICGDTVPASGMGSHLYHKHEGWNSDKYAKVYGEFRKSKLKELKKKEKSTYRCEECDFKASSHKQLVHHIVKYHGDWEDYYVKHYFGGEWPTCNCGCGSKVKLIKSGIDGEGNKTYRRSYVTGHNIYLNETGYRENTQESKEKMRKSAIERMQRKEGTFFTSGPSKSEQEIADFIKYLGFDVIQNDRELLNGLEIDIVIPSKKIAIEYNGGYYHSDLYKNKNYHLKKTKEVNSKGYRLIHIWEFDWHYKKHIVQNIIKNSLGIVNNRYYARKSKVKYITRKESSEFLKNNHLQGSAVSKYNLGLFVDGDLKQVMTFSNLRSATGLSNKSNSYELLRLCSKYDTTVVGGASKLFKRFVKDYKPNSIISYANRDWSLGNVYDSLKMDFKGYTPPGYFYVKSKIKYTRQQFQKHKLVQQGYDESKTEYQIMLERGFYRVWDCGNLRYEWNVEKH